MWRSSAEPIASGHMLVLRGLSRLLQAQILYGLQERTRLDTTTEMFVLRCLMRHLKSAGCASLLDLDVDVLPRHQRGPGADLQRAVACLSYSPEDEQGKDVWNMHVFGHGRKRLDFTVITQP